VDWIYLAKDKDQWQVLVNTVMNTGFPQNAANFLTSKATISFSRRLLFRELVNRINLDR
jgi:hypothetical protein